MEENQDSTVHSEENAEREKDSSLWAGLPLSVKKAAAVAGIVATAATVLATLAGILISIGRMRHEDQQFQLAALQETTKQRDATRSEQEAELRRAEASRQQAEVELQSTRIRIEHENVQSKLDSEQRSADRSRAEGSMLAETLRH